MGSRRLRGPDTDSQPMLVGLENITEAPSGLVARRRPAVSSVLDFRELARWTDRQVGWIAAKMRSDRRSDLFLFTQAAKLVEEMGELHAELLGIGGRQRDKATTFDQSSLAGELADVAICLSISADATGVDLGEAVRAKMRKVDERVAAARRAATG